MKFFFRSIFILIIILFSGSNFARAETISDFSVDYIINKDGSVSVTETITYDFELVSKHGIFRFINKKHPQPATAWYKNRSIEIEVLAVKKDGVSEPYSVSDSNNKLEIKIGNPNVEIRNVHTYEISYRLLGALSYGSEGTEFYWNVTGNDWPLTIQRIVAEVKGENKKILQGKNYCYQGFVGDKSKCNSTEIFSDGLLFKTNNLLSGQGLTIAVELNPQEVSVSIIEHLPYLIIGYILAVFWILLLGYLTYRHRVQNKIDKPVIAQYEPYGDYLPMYTGFIYDNKLDSRDITAGIIYLAEQGFIKIKRTEKKVLLLVTVADYEITLLRPIADMPTKFLKMMSGILFKETTVPPQTVLLSSLIENKVNNRTLIQSLQRSLKEDIMTAGLVTKTLPVWLKQKTLVFLLFNILFIPFLFVTNGAQLFEFVVGISFYIIIFAFMERRTRKGYEVLNHLDGFKLFLSVSDKDRFDFHNAPEKSPELFMKYLPYAIALGVEEKWAKVFEDITVPQPDWYDGNGIGSFSAVTLTNDIGAFSNSFSSSSGTAGSSGGGSSGGGGGGGGGGSW